MNVTDPQYAQLSITKLNFLSTDNVLTFKKFPTNGLVTVSLGMMVNLVNYFNIMFKTPSMIEAALNIGEPDLKGPKVQVKKPDRKVLAEFQAEYSPDSLSRKASYGFKGEKLPQVLSSYEASDSPLFIPHGLSIDGKWFQFNTPDILSLFTGEDTISLTAFSSTLKEIKVENPQGGYTIQSDGTLTISLVYVYN